MLFYKFDLMFDIKNCCSDYFDVGFVIVEIRIFDMTNIQLSSMIGFCSSKAKNTRPKSCRSGTKKMLKHQSSTDSLNIPTEHVLRKRSNSLQSVNSVDNQNTHIKERKINMKPIKIAWASRASSEDKSFETALENWNSCEVFDQVESCAEYKNKFEESKKKSIDIFLSRNFIDPMDVLPSSKPKLGMLKSFGTSFIKHQDSCSSTPTEDLFHEDKKDPESDTNDTKSEKKVTFAADLSRTAETRRLNFRNSYSKRYTTNFSFSSPRLERQTSVGKCPTPKVELRSTMKRGNSLTLAENTEELRSITCTSPSLKQSIQTDKMKQLLVKRKLKSCRSRSFHKSFDNSSVIENFDTFSFPKPLKTNQNAEVVTMVSLIVSNEDQESDVSNKSHAEKAEQLSKNTKENDTKLEKQTKTGILKSRWTDNIKRANIQSTQKRRIINVSHKITNSPEKTRTILTSVDNVVNSENSRLDTVNSDTKNCEENNDDKGAENKPFQSSKEQECWSSFRKMSNKGFSVSFDTILRGLLTPTEYRLRKNELLTQDS